MQVVLPVSADGSDVGSELSRVVNFSVVLQGRNASFVDIYDRIQGAIVPRLLWQSDVGPPEESKKNPNKNKQIVFFSLRESQVYKT